MGNKKRVHRRGGSYDLKVMEDVTNWSGRLLNREILNHIQIGDYVRVIFESGWPRYIKVTELLSNGVFKGVVDDCYNNRYCNICREEGLIKRKPLHYCNNWKCDFDCHLECMKKHPEMVCQCDKNEFPIEKWKPYLLNGSTIIFKKNNISEIPKWSKNTEKLIDIYLSDGGYLFTGFR